MRAPAAVVAIPLIAGVLGGVYAGTPSAIPAALFACAGSAAGCVAWRRKRPVLLIVSCAAAFFAAGATVGARADEEALAPALLAWWHALPEDARDDPVTLEGTLKADAARSDFGATLTLDVDRVVRGRVARTVRGGVRLSVSGTRVFAAIGAWRQGRRLRVAAALREPLDYRDPGLTSDRVRLARQGTVLLGSVKSALLVGVRARGSLAAEAAGWVRAQVRRGAAAAIGRWSAQSAGIVTAILIGDRSGLRPEDERRLQEAGTYHVIAISGGNIVLVMAIVIAMARRVRLRPRGASAATLLVVAFYGYLAGLAPSVQRATLVGVLWLAARLIDHRGPAINALGVAAAFAAIAAPLSILDGGFVLSFGATLGILLLADRLVPRRPPERSLSRAQRVRRTLIAAAAALLAATVCAELALAPVSARLFGRISLAGLLLNFAAIPLMSLAQISGALAVATQPVLPDAAGLIGWVAHISARGLLESARLVDVRPWLVLDVPPPGLVVVAAWYAGIAVACFSAPRRVRRLGILLAVSAAVVMVAAPSPARADAVPPVQRGWLRVVFLDVGQGDATLVMAPGARPLLVDAGGVFGSSFDIGRRVVVPALWALGADRLGVLALTHGDPDHIGGADAVLRALGPAEVWEGIPVPRHAPLRRLRAEAASHGIAWREVHTGERRHLGPIALRILHPDAPDWERQKVRNDDSVVIELRYGSVAVLLPGDIGAEGESAVTPLIHAGPLTIVKAPHHGSATSSSRRFIETLHPAAVVFSAGRHNPFGHPAPDVVERYVSAGARVFRTDLDGAVVLDTDGRTAAIWTWTGRGVTFTRDGP
ncbi:MAG TPA: DNA internalization-related competence protein ComEC/Rec2 [Vicinamibacterales bacterium]|nr:DNA internalization-related competence protein ComEC/Rec2 [Vicinamibacterales bacterium]